MSEDADVAFICFNCRYVTANRWNMRRHAMLNAHGFKVVLV